LPRHAGRLLPFACAASGARLEEAMFFSPSIVQVGC
jgi:hypothetical protein